ncbi:G-protein coupled receptor GRL101-like [Anneissia japonica]|uniref:G-protein coupled receptor GRL101-like n=1 Tax=Anneissia japonica TaxID=1529436 RepID=UPI001425AA9F|nr:G-protein coupled receptor GRL101-like [Anneissia japonica]
MQNEVLRFFLWIFGWSALLGNMFVIAWRARHWPRQNSKSYTQSFLVTNLAVSDALMGVYLLIVACADVYYHNDYIMHAKYWKQSYICMAAGILAVLSSESSVFTLTVISWDRFVHIAFPFQSFHLTPKTVKRVVAVCWILMIILSVLPVLPFAYFNDSYYGVTSVCLALPLTSERVQGWEYTVSIIICLNLICFILIFISYTGIFVVNKRSRNSVNKISSASSLKNQQISLAVRMAFIVATDFCCWVPVIIMGILSLTNTVKIPASVYAWAAVFILPVNSAINPFLYTISSLKQLQKNMSPTKNTSGSNPRTKTTSRLDTKLQRSTSKKDRKQTKNIYLLKKILRVLESEINADNNTEDKVNQLLLNILALANNTEVCQQQTEIKFHNESNVNSDSDRQEQNDAERI